MKKMYIALAMVLLLPLSFAETKAIPLGMQATVPRVHVDTLALVGHGFAISESDPTDFSVIKVGVAKVDVELGQEKRTLVSGLLFVDGIKYRLKNATVANGTFYADIYANGTKVGTMSASSLVKNKEIVWYGESTLNEKTYRIYIAEARRPFRPAEMGKKIGLYCREHPEDKACKGVRGNITQYCESHPKDTRCVAIQKRYCANHLNDERCRSMIISEGSNETESNEAVARYSERYCKKYPERCSPIARRAIERAAKMKHINAKMHAHSDVPSNASENKSGEMRHRFVPTHVPKNNVNNEASKKNPMNITGGKE